MSKRDSQKSHFRRRVFERYGITINEGEYEYLVSQIKKRTAQVTFLYKQSNRVSIHKIIYKQLSLVVVYDKLRKSLITALPQDCVEVANIHNFVLEFEDS